MIQRHRRGPYVILLYLCLSVLTHHQVSGTAQAPVDYLIPPPAPIGTRLNPTKPLNLLASESRTVPQHYVDSNSQTISRTGEEPGIMNRVARWFGFATQNFPIDQQASATGNNKQFYYYPKPQQLGTGNKEPCSLCNKFPWVPMMFNSVQYPWDLSKQTQQFGNPPPAFVRNNFAPNQQQHAAASVKQRAVQFAYPPPPPSLPANSNGYQQPNNVQYSSGPFLPIPIPNLNNAVLPPLYNAKPFHQTFEATASPPTTQSSHFVDNIASAHSEIHLDTVVPTQIPPSTPIKDPNFEIIKSHQLVDYISSVEYPASYVPSQSYDVQLGSTQYRPEVRPTVSTGRYQHATFSPQLNQHIPASQILTEPGNFIVGDNAHQVQYNQQQSTLQSEIVEHTTQLYDHIESFDNDNYASASIHNSSVFIKPQQISDNIDSWTIDSNNYNYGSTTPDVPTSTTTERPTEFEYTTESPLSNDVEFIASIQTSKENDKIKSSLKSWPEKTRNRETPKRLLDAPIQHISGNLGSPRPFTRDPSEYGLRLAAKNHKFAEMSFSAAEPTPTSTYSSVDASGQYAGMSPPALPVSPNRENSKHLQLPFTTKVQPRPFEPIRDSSVTKPSITDNFSTWSQTQNTDLHTPAESMLVSVKSEINPSSPSTPKPRPTKYLTKILASNLKELLQREHTASTKLKQSPNSIGFDLHTLQKNIDDWTEQEYTSLSHRPSTPTILGRSKHIPKEFLPSTTATISATQKPSRQSKTTKGFFDTSELTASINSLEPLYERASTKRFQYTPVNDNHIQESYESLDVTKTTTTTTMRPTTTRTTTTEKPLFMVDMDSQEPEEQWRKAKVSISPKTKEKVYVVTPQPSFFNKLQLASTTTTTTTTETPPNHSNGSGFKSPRFLVRPTPGNVTANNLLKILGTTDSSRQFFDFSKENLSNSYFSHDLFGLKGLSAYVPSEPVEINDGNSKVHNLRTPSSNQKVTTPQNIMDLTKDRHSNSQKKRPILAPSPR